MVMTRRSLLQGAALGVGVLTLPRWLAGCAKGVPPQAAAGEDPFLAWFGIDEGVLRRVLSTLTANGASFADAFFQHSRVNSISMEDGIVSRASTSIDQGVGLRTVLGDQTGFAFTEDLTEASMLAAARTAAAIARGSAGSIPGAFTRPTPIADLYNVAVPWSEIGVDRKLPLLQRVESLARGLDPAVSKVSVSWVDEEQHVLVADSQGRISQERRPQSRLFCTVTATRDGKSFSNGANLAGRRGFEWYTDAELATVARQAVERTMILFEAGRPPAGELPVVLAAGASGILLHEAIGHGLEADFNRKNISIYASMIGEQIAPDFVTIIDSGLEPGERGAIAFDDEGNPAKRTTLVEKGRLVSYLHDQTSAAHYKVESTGSGRRQSFRYPPMPRMRCTFMESGPHSRDEIIASVQNGIIAETFTNGQVQIGAGDFTFYVKNGWLIEGGKVTAPIKDVNIIGNGPEALKRVTMAANDAVLDSGGWTCGKDGQSVPVSQGLPTVLVSALSVGGSDA